MGRRVYSGPGSDQIGSDRPPLEGTGATAGDDGHKNARATTTRIDVHPQRHRQRRCVFHSYHGRGLHADTNSDDHPAQ